MCSAHFCPRSKTLETSRHCITLFDHPQGGRGYIMAIFILYCLLLFNVNVSNRIEDLNIFVNIFSGCRKPRHETFILHLTSPCQNDFNCICWNEKDAARTECSWHGPPDGRSDSGSRQSPLVSAGCPSHYFQILSTRHSLAAFYISSARLPESACRLLSEW